MLFNWVMWFLVGLMLLIAILVIGKKLLAIKLTPRERFGSKRYLAFFMGSYASVSTWIKAGLMLYNENWSTDQLIKEGMTLVLSVALVGLLIYIFFAAPVPQSEQCKSTEGKKENN